MKRKWGYWVLGLCCVLSMLVVLAVGTAACADSIPAEGVLLVDAGVFDAHFNAKEFCEVCKKQGVLEEQERETLADVEKLKAEKAQLEIEIDLLKQLQPEHKP